MVWEAVITTPDPNASMEGVDKERRPVFLSAA